MAPAWVKRMRGLGVRGEGAVVVGNDQGVAAKGFAGIGLVFEPAEQPFFGEQAFEEGEVAFPVLHGHAALGVGGGVGQAPLPVRDELTLPFPVGEEFIDDVDDALVLEEVVVAVMAEEGEPGFDDQPVTAKATVSALARDLRNVPMEGAPHIARGRGLQVETNGLAEQGCQRLLGVGRQRTEFDAETGVFDNRPEGFVDCHRSASSASGPGRRGQFEQAVVLAPAGAAGDHVDQGIHGLVCRERGWPGRRSAQFPETDVERVTGCRLAAQRPCTVAVDQSDQPAGRAITLNEGDDATPAEKLAGDLAEALIKRNDLRQGIAFGQPVSQPVGTAAHPPAGKRPGCNGLRTGQRSP